MGFKYVERRGTAAERVSVLLSDLPLYVLSGGVSADVGHVTGPPVS